MTDTLIVGLVGAAALVATQAMGLLQHRKTMVIVEKVHTLVNSNMSIQLRVNMLQARRIAALTNLETDAELAKESERLYNDQLAKQKEADK